MKIDATLGAICCIDATIDIPIEIDEIIQQTLRELIIDKLNDLTKSGKFLEIDEYVAFGEGITNVRVKSVQFKDFYAPTTFE